MAIAGDIAAAMEAVGDTVVARHAEVVAKADQAAGVALVAGLVIASRMGSAPVTRIERHNSAKKCNKTDDRYPKRRTTQHRREIRLAQDLDIGRDVASLIAGDSVTHIGKVVSLSPRMGLQGFF